MAPSASTAPMIVGRAVQMLRSQYLAGFKGTAYPTVPVSGEKTEATIDKTIDELAKDHPELTPVLYNDVKVCGGCGKPCAFTLIECNSCGRSLKDVEISKSENVFSAFLFGVKKAGKGFPYTISLRQLSENVLIMDDLLALTPCHLNAIPRNYYIPDWRFLLTDPKKALELLDVMEEEAWQVTKSFLQHSNFRETIFRGSPSDEDIRKKVIRCFNYPPSQYQMHIQWIVPPLVPFHHYMAEIHNHFHEDRCFPLDYVRQVLKLNEPYPDLMQSTPIEDITTYYEKRGVSYKEFWAKFYETSIESCLEYHNWDTNDFEYVVENGKVHELIVEEGKIKLGKEVDGANPTAIQAKDKVALQNYGRPYDVEGKPSGTYVSKPLKLTIGPGGYGKWPGVKLSNGIVPEDGDDGQKGNL